MPDTSTLARFTYNPSTLRYRDRQTGQFVKAATVRQAVDAIIDKETVRIRAISQSLIDGSINLAEWQLQTQSLLKNLHVSMGLAACGGLSSTSASDLGFIASQIKTQYQYLRDFAYKIKNGTQLLDGTLVSRAAQYTQASRATYENTVQRSAKAAGLSEEKNILGDADSCSGCLSAAQAGWSPIGTLVPIGQRQCRSNCHCRFVYRA